ncbi:MAG TPA: LysR family transcriptional regulator [Pseudolysinimonas sp.]
MSAPFRAGTPSADDLLVLLAVARAGRFTTAGAALGMNHTTVARRISALEASMGGRVLERTSAGWTLTPLGRRAAGAGEEVERAVAAAGDSPAGSPLTGVIRLSATDGFSGFVAAPAMAALRREHPGVALEIVAVTRQASQQRAGADLEVIVGRPQVRQAEALKLADYVLGLYASRDLLAANGTPRSRAELAGAPLVYFIESMLQVDALDDARQTIPEMFDAVTSTNVYVHVEATRAGAGFGLLPCFLADRHPELVRVLPDQVGRTLPYWLVGRPEAFRQPVITAYVDALRARLHEVREQLAGRRG